MSSVSETPWAVYCPKHGKVFLTRDEYEAQMDAVNTPWTCPRECGPPEVGICGEPSEWDDLNYEAHLPPEGASP
jgi:hypothetical protein